MRPHKPGGKLDPKVINCNLKEVAKQILTERPDPVVFYCLLRDVLKKLPDDH